MDVTLSESSLTSNITGSMAQSTTKGPLLDDPSTSDATFVPTSSSTASKTRQMPFRVWSGDRRLRKSLVAKTCAEVMVKAASKMEIPDVRKCCLVLERCGTEVDDDDYLGMLPSNCVLMLLQSGEKWSQPHSSSTQLVSNIVDDTLTLNLGLSSTSAPTVPKLCLKTSPLPPLPSLPLKPRTFSKSPENSRSPSGSRESSLPLPSPSAFANIKTFAIEGCIPTAFSVQGCSGSSFSTPAPLTPAPPPAPPPPAPLTPTGGYTNASSLTQLDYQSRSIEGGIIISPEQHQQQQQLIPAIQLQQRTEICPPTRGTVKHSSGDGGGGGGAGIVSSSVPALQNNVVNGIVSYGASSNGVGLTPIVISSSHAMSSSSSSSSGFVGSDASSPMDVVNGADNCPIYALGPLGPFFVASGSGFVASGNCAGGASVGGASVVGSGVGGASVVGGGVGGTVRGEFTNTITNGAVLGISGSRILQGLGSANVDSDAAAEGSGAVEGGVTQLVSPAEKAADNAVEIVTPPLITSAGQMAKLQKSSDERFRRRSKNLPCTVAGCQKVFRDEYDRKTHLRCHTGERPFKCFSCDKSFAHVSSRIHHHKTLHLKKREFVCSICGKSFVKRIEAQRHQWTAHRIPSAPSLRNEGTCDLSATVVDSTTSDSK